MDLTPAAKRAYQIQSYGPAPTIEGVQIVELKRFSDDGGSMTELARLTDGHPAGVRAASPFARSSYSEVEPGAIKAFHLHQRQTDIWYVPPSDRMLVVLVDVRRGLEDRGDAHASHSGRGGSRMVRIPPGVAHGVCNLVVRAGPHHLLHRRPFLARARDVRRGPVAVGLCRREDLGRDARVGR